MNDKIKSLVAFYPVKSIAETAAFYEEKLGLEAAQQTERQRIYRCGAGYLGFVEYGEDPLPARRICISFNCENTEEVDAAYRSLVSAGVVCDTEPAKHPAFPVYSFFLTDPDGYRLEFQKVLNAEL